VRMAVVIMAVGMVMIVRRVVLAALPSHNPSELNPGCSSGRGPSGH